MPFDGAMFCNDNGIDELALRLEGHKRILFWGDMGVGKSTLALALARSLSRRFGRGQILSLDPGTPPFGIPGSVSRGWWSADGLEWTDYQALCSLNASRFRLPLVIATGRLMAAAEAVDKDGPFVIDPPGVVRGVGGAELLIALAQSLRVDVVVALYRQEEPMPLAEELASFPMEVIYIPASPEAKRPPSSEKARRRTALWDRFLAEGVEKTFSLDRVRLLGTPPPREVPEAWTGRQAAFLNAAGDTLQMGEVVRLTGDNVTVRMPAATAQAPGGLLIRDAGRNAEGLLETTPRIGNLSAVLRPFGEKILFPVAPGTGNAPLPVRVGSAWATLVGGVLGDPLLHVRISNVKQSLLFDLGDPGRLAAKTAHQVTAVFLSHAHMDHIGGFMWFLRSRIGAFKPCKIFGPAETITRIENFLGAVTWDRIEDNGPVFEVCEFDGTSLRCARLQPAQRKVALPNRPVLGGVVLSEAEYDVQAVICDHHIPSVAYALLFRREINIGQDRLAASGLLPGPWLGELKRCIAGEHLEAEIRLPDGSTSNTRQLAKALALVRPGKKLVYAADVADTPDNRKKLIDLALSADTFFCEAAFAQADSHKAAASQHLTTLAAASIARAAGVEQLVPFHFSKRYEHNPGLLYDEIRAAAGTIRIIGPMYPRM